MTTTHVILACDESGAKGYANNDEQDPGEVGIFAGIMVPKECWSLVKPAFDELVKQYFPATGKLHVTELPPAQQCGLRTTCFDLIRQYKLPCFYEAIHVAGFQSIHKIGETSILNARKSRRSSIKISQNMPPPKSLHSTLFQGLYSKLIAFCMERGCTNLIIEVLTDNIDKKILKEFYDMAQELLNNEPKVRKKTGFDPNTKCVVSGTITTSTSMPLLPIEVDSLTIRTANNEGIVIAADVLANSLNKLFRDRSEHERFSALNTPQAFANHPLKDCLYSFNDWSGCNFTDTFYRHPKDPNYPKDSF